MSEVCAYDCRPSNPVAVALRPMPAQRPHAMDLHNLRGGLAVLTGSGSVTGLGFAMARKAASLGMHVLISDVRQNAVDEAVAKLR
eukprot:COSAG01_NODE_66672_length_269_cov_0.894118_1_plen_84_part_01